MTVSVLDPAVALVVIDLQKGVMGIPTAHPSDDVVQRSADLARAFRAAGRPVVLVNATGRAPGRTEQGTGASRVRPAADWAEIVPALEPQASDIRVSKQTWGAFHNTNLDAELAARGVTQVVLTGIATSAGVESTARAAHEHGYHVVLATDAMTDRDQATHDYVVQRVFPRIGETATTAELLDLLAASVGP